MEVKEKKSVAATEKSKQETLLRKLNNLLKKLETPGIVQGLLGSYLDGELSLDDLITSIEDLTEDKAILKNRIPVFDENLEIDHVVDKEYGLMANYKPLFDEHQNLVGFVPHWVYEKE